MRRYITLVVSFITMLSLGSVYAWSIIAGELKESYGFSTSQTQIVFGTIIALFPATMILVSRLSSKIKPGILGVISGLLFIAGNLISGYSQGNFFDIFIGSGVITGVATGFGYWLSLTTSVMWFPQKKGIITGIVAAGFGLGAVVMSNLSELILENGKDVLELIKTSGLIYGFTIVILSFFVSFPPSYQANISKIKTLEYLKHRVFLKLVVGIFLGTFAGLLIIGNLSLIGEHSSIHSHYLIMGVSLFALSNFLGRVAWGFVADFAGAKVGIFTSLAIQAIAIYSLNIIPMSNISYLILVFMTGFGFGGNFVLFAKHTANSFGVERLGAVYPFVFLGYALAGVSRPYIGGLLFDITGNYSSAITLSAIMSLTGALLFFYRRILSLISC